MVTQERCYKNGMDLKTLFSLVVYNAGNSAELSYIYLRFYCCFFPTYLMFPPNSRKDRRCSVYECLTSGNRPGCLCRPPQWRRSPEPCPAPWACSAGFSAARADGSFPLSPPLVLETHVCVLAQYRSQGAHQAAFWLSMKIPQE